MANHKALIFGISGQDGWYLTNILTVAGIEVIGISRSNPEYTIGEVSDTVSVQELIKHHQPAYIFHLAANSTTRHESLFENYQAITTGTLNILESVYKYCPNSKVFISGSGLQFVNNGLPISESDAFEARDSYSMARIQSVYAARYYRSLGIKVYIGYFFNHDSPLRSERHINQKIALIAKNIAQGHADELKIGDIHVKKEFGFAGDIAEAIWRFVGNENVFEATIGTGKAHAIAEWIELCFAYYDLDWHKHVSPIPGFTSDYKILVSDPSTIRSLGWEPLVNIDDLAHMMLYHNLNVT